MTVVLAITSDQHAGSTVALCPPRIRLDDDGHYEASPAQRWIWQHWQDFWKRADQTRKRHKGSKLYQVYNGDMTDGDHHGTTQILSGNPTAQAAVVDALMKVPLALKPDAMFFVRGTEVHVGKSGCHEERIASGLKKDGWPVQPDPDTGSASRWHLRMEVEGVRIDIAHHGRVGTRPWTKPNVVANLAAEIFYDHCKDGIPHPHLAIRSHMHQFVDTASLHPTRVIQMPAWQLATAFIHRIAPGKLADIGGVIVVIDNGRILEVDPVIVKPQPSTVWRAA